MYRWLCRLISVASLTVVVPWGCVGIGTTNNDSSGDDTETLVFIPEGSSLPGCEETDECFIPFQISITVGGTVMWTNDDSAVHTVTSGNPMDGPDGEFDSSLITERGEFTHTFDSAGAFSYYCILHPWQEGIVMVDP